MSVIGLVFNVCSRNGDTTFSLFGRFVDGAILKELCVALLCLSLRDGSCESSLACVSWVKKDEGGKLYLSVVDMANRTCSIRQKSSGLQLYNVPMLT